MITNRRARATRKGWRACWTRILGYHLSSSIKHFVMLSINMNNERTMNNQLPQKWTGNLLVTRVIALTGTAAPNAIWAGIPWKQNLMWVKKNFTPWNFITFSPVEKYQGKPFNSRKRFYIQNDNNFRLTPDPAKLYPHHYSSITADNCVSLAVPVHRKHQTPTTVTQSKLYKESVTKSFSLQPRKKGKNDFRQL